MNKPVIISQNENLTQLRIGTTDVFLEEMGANQGKITVSDTYGYNYSHWWGAMDGTLKEFVTHIDSEYFADKLLGSRDNHVINVRKTFASLRKYIATEIMPWYDHQEFQKDMRSTLNYFQKECEERGSEQYFVDQFHWSFIRQLSFYRIQDRYESRRIEEAFNSINEPWMFIEHSPSPEYLWLKQTHKEIKKVLKSK